MADQASISRVNLDGSVNPIWLTSHHKGRSPEALLRTVMRTQDLKPATYVVAWTNKTGIPKVQAFTVLDSASFLPGIVAPAARVNRWPPAS